MFSLILFSRVGDFDGWKKLMYSDYIGKGNFSTKNDPIPTSKYAFVQIFIGDDQLNHYSLQAELLGYQMQKYNNSIDRVLLLPTNISLTEKHEKILKRVYTHFIYRPFIQWTTKGPEKEPWEKLLYFKLNIWSLNYSKVFYVSGFNVFLRDPSSIFEFYPPVAAPDYDTWTIAKYGPTQNTDFMLIKPSLTLFNDIIRFGSSNYTSQDVVSTNLWETAQGPYDNGLIVTFFKGDIATLQWWWNYELPGHYIFKLHHIERYFDEHVVSIKYSAQFLPWVDTKSETSLVWTKAAEELYSSLNEALEYEKYGIIPSKGRNVTLKKKIEKTADVNTEASRFYPEFREICDKQFLIQALLIILISVAFVAYALTQSNDKTAPFRF